MSGRYLLDTSIVVALFRGERTIEARLVEDVEIFLPSVVLGELYFGAAHSHRRDANAARIDEFATACTLLPIDRETARLYGRLKSQLRAGGHPIPENDLWIASCALQHDLVLVTRDGHFAEVEGIVSESW